MWTRSFETSPGQVAACTVDSMGLAALRGAGLLDRPGRSPHPASVRRRTRRGWLGLTHSFTARMQRAGRPGVPTQTE